MRKYLSAESTKKLEHALVTSGIDYCNSLLYDLPKTYLSMLQSKPRARGLFVTFPALIIYLSPVLYTFDRLPVQFRFKI